MYTYGGNDSIFHGDSINTFLLFRLVHTKRDVLLCSLCMHCVTYGIARLWLILVYLVWQHDPMDYVRRLILCVYRIAARNCFAENNHAIAEQIVNFCKKKNVLQKMKKRRDGKNQKSTFGIDIDTVIRSIKKSECLTKTRRRKIV